MAAYFGVNNSLADLEETYYFFPNKPPSKIGFIYLFPNNPEDPKGVEDVEEGLFPPNIDFC
jgi:hypothetical protein